VRRLASFNVSVGSFASFSVLRSDVGYYAESDHGAVIWKRRRRATHVTPTLGLADDGLGLCGIGYADGEVLPPPPCPRPAVPRRPRARLPVHVCFSPKADLRLVATGRRCIEVSRLRVIPRPNSCHFGRRHRRRRGMGLRPLGNDAPMSEADDLPYIALAYGGAPWGLPSPRREPAFFTVMTYTSRARGGRQDCTRAKDAAQVSKPKRDAPFSPAAEQGRSRTTNRPPSNRPGRSKLDAGRWFRLISSRARARGMLDHALKLVTRCLACQPRLSQKQTFVLGDRKSTRCWLELRWIPLFEPHCLIRLKNMGFWLAPTLSPRLQWTN
jgi:hypothetical protein